MIPLDKELYQLANNEAFFDDLLFFAYSLVSSMSQLLNSPLNCLTNHPSLKI